MVHRLTFIMIWLSVTIIVSVFGGCLNTGPVVISEFCQTFRGKLPLGISRKDGELRQRNLVAVNTFHKEHCLNGTVRK